MINKYVLDEMINEAGQSRQEKASEYMEQKKVYITKVLFDDSDNFEIKAKVNGKNNIYDTYIKIEDGEIFDVECTCPDYESHYGTCKHILASMMEFENNPEYIKIFTGKESKDVALELDDVEINNKEEQSITFRQLLDVFYNELDDEKKDTNLKNNIEKRSVKIVPKMIIDKYYDDELRIEFKIGQKQLYKLKNLTEFYDNMMLESYHKYGAKLEFVHKEEVFEEESIPMLNFILKYAELIKTGNNSQSVYYRYNKPFNETYINLSGTGLDELFEIMKDKYIDAEDYNRDFQIKFEDKEPNIKFDIEETAKDKYKISPNFDKNKYKVFFGKKYAYILLKNNLYRCSKQYCNSITKIINIFKYNYVNDIEFKKQDLSLLFSMVVPKIKNSINTKKIPQEDIEKFMPKSLSTKIFLDYNDDNNIIADVKFCYNDIEFNPFKESEEPSIAKDFFQEREVINMFTNSGFLLDQKEAKLIMLDDEKIFNFLTVEIEEYMKKFEVLVTEKFRQKEVKMPEITNLGVRIENNLLEINLENVDFELSELQNILTKYKLKKKYHRLKDGSFINLNENNDTIEFLENISKGVNLEYDKLEKGKINVPMYRGLYLDELLKKHNVENVSKDKNYRKFVNEIGKKDFEQDVDLPKNFNASLREYQKTGYNWLEGLEDYKLGGVLADDMGLGKTIQMLAVIQKYKEDTKKEDYKPSIVVCPSSLTLNWRNEASKFTSLETLPIRGSAEERKLQIKNTNIYDVVITSYDLLKRDIEVYKQYDIQFKYIIADEAQYIKNNNTQNAKAIKEIKGETKYALTGTPIENSLSELWSIFDFVMPGYLFSYKQFKDLYESPIVKQEDSKAMERLKMLISPFVLRRTKKEVLTELPEKTITVLNNEMQKEQQGLYLAYLAQAKVEALQEINEKGFEKSQIKILALLTRLRQICCHPRLFIENYEGNSSKLDQCIEIIKDGIESNHRILLFSGFTSMFPMLEKELNKENIKYFKLTGSTKVGDRISMVDEFNANENIKVFLISLKAGGTGLNLTGADMVIHYDPWWNLSAENQATDRTYRIGQKRNVQVYKLITKNSIEEKIYELQQKKAKLMDDMLSTKETFISKLSKDEIMDLFK